MDTTSSPTTAADALAATRAHDSNQWWVIRQDNGDFYIKSYSEHCQQRIVPTIAHIPDAGGSAQDKLDGLLLTAAPRLNGLDPSMGYHIVRCTGRECLACKSLQHNSDTYALTEHFKDVCWTLRNLDATCPGRLFHATERLQDIVNLLLVNPTHQQFANIFILGHTDRDNRMGLHTDEDYRHVRVWGCEGERAWRAMTKAGFVGYVSRWLHSLLVPLQLEMAEGAKKLQKALDMVKHHAQVAGIVAAILSTVRYRCAKIEFDTNPDLLGCDDCVIDLRLGVARQPRMEDYVSWSVGYSFLAGGPHDIASVERIMEQIYPVPEERAFMRRWMAYCLTGQTDKGFLCLTDRRKGFTGKTTIVALMARAMGPYAVTGAKKELFYQTNAQTTINSHNSGVMAFTGKRMAAFEELSANRKLEVSFLKELTGGDVTLQVRQAHAASEEPMRWTSKIMMMFNEGAFPQFNTDDHPFLQRMFVLQHRARFCTPEELGADSQPHTFLADKAVPDAVTPQAMLTYMLGGLGDYWQHRLTAVPAVIQTWRQQLAEERDEVAQWVAEHVEDAPESFIHLMDAFGAFKRQTGSKLGKIKFNEKLRGLLSGWLEQKKVAGVTYKNVYCGHALI